MAHNIIIMLYVFCSAFIRPKVGKLHENSCLVRQFSIPITYIIYL